MSALPAPGSIVRIRDERWVVGRLDPGDGAAVLEVRGCGRTNLGTRATFLLPFEVLEPLASSDAPALVRRRRWRHVARAALAGATPSWGALRTARAARISLLPFQLEPALAVTHGHGVRLLVADDVGLGKTIQAGLLISEVLERTSHGRVLVVAPAALREQWHAELTTRFGLDVWIADSYSLARLGMTWAAAGNPWSAHPVTITSIDFIKRPEAMRAVEPLVWDTVVFDEAHALSGRSDRAAAARALARRARTVVLLTATPHSGDDQAFHALCDIGDIDAGFPLLVFRRTRSDAGLAISRRTRTLRVRPTPAEQAMHDSLMVYARRVWTRPGPLAGAARLAMGTLVRRACSSPASLARSVERRIAFLDAAGSLSSQMALPFLDPPADEEPGAELAAPGLENRDEEQRALNDLWSLATRAGAGESKVAALARLLRRAGEPAIVFTEYRDTLAHLAAAFQTSSPVTLHGGLTAAERRDALRAFTTGTARLLLATDAASEGLNLQQRCRLVINLEVPWTPLRLEQRVGRVERIGQTRRVHEVRLVAAGTAEESALESLGLRAERAAVVLDALRPGPTEDRIAGAAINQEPVTQATAHDPLSSSVVVPDLRHEADIEASRVETLRRTVRGSDGLAGEGRPLLTVFRRSTRRSALCAFRLTFSDAERRVIWDTLVGAIAADPATGAGGIGGWIRAIDAIGVTCIPDEQRRALVSLETALKAPLDLARRREQAIADSLRRDRARLATALLQPGLFDRRAEHTLAAQRAVLDEALARCHARLDEIARARGVVADRPRLAFAALCR